jgi:quinoprotein glucose dehydrogenase
MWRIILSGSVCLATLLAQGQPKAPAAATPKLVVSPGDWPMYSHDLSGTRYSPLTQITSKNVANLKPAWTYRLRSDAERNAAGGGGVAGYSEVTPIVVNGVMYSTG